MFVVKSVACFCSSLYTKAKQGRNLECDSVYGTVKLGNSLMLGSGAEEP